MHRRDGFFLARDNEVVRDEFAASLSKSVFRSLHDGIFDERLPHGIFQSVFMNAINNESNFWLDHDSSSGPRLLCTRGDVRKGARLEYSSSYCFFCVLYV